MAFGCRAAVPWIGQIDYEGLTIEEKVLLELMIRYKVFAVSSVNP